jgi:thymidylate kinase
VFVAFEGIDGGGKSTFARDLSSTLEKQGFAVTNLHRGVPERPVLDEYQFDVENYRPGRNQAIIADRWHWGDLVYGELYRGESYLGTGGFRFVELFLRSRGAITVLVENEPGIIRNRLLARGEDYLKLEHIDHVLEHYRTVFNSSATGVIRTNEPDVAEVLKHAEFWSTQAEDLAPFAGYVGGRTPRVLLVGDKRGNSATPSVTAFRPTVKGNSADFLLSALPGSLWRDVGLVNANEETDLEGLLDVLAQPPVIALGEEASKRLTQLDVEHAGLPHPQWMRRFKHAEQLNYGQKIVALIGKDVKEFSWPH